MAHNDPVDFDDLNRRVDAVELPLCRGEVTGVSESSIEGRLPGARLGRRVSVVTRTGDTIPAEVASFRGADVKMLPLRDGAGIGPGDRIEEQPGGDEIHCSDALLGRIINALGEPVDGGDPILPGRPWSIDRPAPDPLKRRSVRDPFVTGIRSIDGCLTLGEGQRVGLFSGPGIGKSTLLGTLARRSSADVSVICLVGERGREVLEFLDNQLRKEGREKSVVVLATADAPPLVRAKALQVATAVAEWFRASGRRVLLLVDSLTRVVRARRDMALALGEHPARGGFPPSSFSLLPGLLERTGCDENGAITAVYAVLTEGEGDDVVAEETRSLLDGHIVLSPKLAGAGRWPAIDINRSISRVMGNVASEHHLDLAGRLRRMLGAYEAQEDLILMGAYRRGTSPDTDMALDRLNEIDAFLRQSSDDDSSLDATVLRLEQLLGGRR